MKEQNESNINNNNERNLLPKRTIATELIVIVCYLWLPVGLCIEILSVMFAPIGSPNYRSGHGSLIFIICSGLIADGVIAYVAYRYISRKRPSRVVSISLSVLILLLVIISQLLLVYLFPFLPHQT